MISIVITTRNRLEGLKRALDSALNQTIECEIIVSDNNSDDGTQEYLSGLNDERINYIRWDTTIPGLLHWMLAFMASHGDWIKYLFDDDYLEPDCCQKLLAQINEHTTVSMCATSFPFANQTAYDKWNPSIPIPQAVRDGVLSVSPVNALISRLALIEGFSLLPRLSDRALKWAVGPVVLMNYATVAGHPERFAYTSEVLCHMDDLGGDQKAGTVWLRENEPDILRECHDESYDILDDLAKN
jgi:glycosyltransferase involved in cell wall biosynthesis